MAYIYKIENLVNGKIYIGSTINYKERFRNHTSELNRNTHQNNHLQSAWNKHGEKNFKFSIICEIKDELKYSLEQWFLDNIKPFDNNGYNICKQARGGIADNIDYKKDRIGELHPKSIITNEDAINIKKMICEGYSTKYISLKTGINSLLIANIKSLLCWKEVGSEYNKKILSMTNKHEEKQDCLTNRELIVIHKLKKKGKSFSEIASLFEISTNILNRDYKIYIAKNNNKLSSCEKCKKQIIKKSNNQKYCQKCSKEKQKDWKIKSMKNIRKNDINLKNKDELNISQEKENNLKPNRDEVKQEKINILNKNKDVIIQMYQYNNFSVSKILKNINKESYSIDSKTLKEFLNENGILNNEKPAIIHTQYVSVINHKSNKTVDAFKNLWECSQWMIQNNICEKYNLAKNYIKNSNKNNVEYQGYVFKYIVEDDYNSIKAEEE